MIKNRTRHSRILSLLALVLIFTIIVATMTSCSKKHTEKAENESVEDYVARIISTNEQHRVRFIAASRGHDISSYYSSNKKEAASFEDSDEIKDPNVGVAQSILDEIIDADNFKNEASKTAFVNFRNNLTSEQILTVAEKLKTTANLEVNNGFFDKLLVGIGKALGWLTGLVGSYYVIAILIFAVVVEILMLPVSIKQQKNSIGMAKLRPKMAKIEKKYAGRNDQATLMKKREEIMQLQQQEGYSAFSGCLPLILQLIIVGFILYPIIQNPLRYMLNTADGLSSALVSYATSPKAVGGLGMTMSGKGNVIELLSVLNSENIKGIADFALLSNGDACLSAFNGLAIPDFTMFTINVAPVPKLTFAWPAVILLLVPILNIAVQIVSMKLNKKWAVTPQPAGGDAQTNASMKIMEWIGPAMTLFIMFQVPALIGIYWLFRSLLAILKQYILKVAMPVPQYTEEELREMEKAEKEIQKAQKEAAKAQNKHRSLHYIDDDDYEILPDAPQSEEKKNTKLIDGEIPEIKD